MSEIVNLPQDGDPSGWSEQEKALVEAAGLVYKDKKGGAHLADRPTVEAFLAHCRRTGLDPIARQIYAIRRGRKWGIQVSIDGMRLVAERSGEYAGQTPVQWTGDGKEWVDVWLADEPPKAARVGVYRNGFVEPLTSVARWDSYAVYDDVWENGQRTGQARLSSMWAKMPDLMLAKVCEMNALRKAFPMELSGLYGAEELEQAEPQRAPEPAEPSQDWKKLADRADSYDLLKQVHEQAAELKELGLVVVGDEEGRTVDGYLRARKTEIVDAGREGGGE